MYRGRVMYFFFLLKGGWPEFFWEQGRVFNFSMTQVHHFLEIHTVKKPEVSVSGHFLVASRMKICQF